MSTGEKIVELRPSGDSATPRLSSVSGTDNRTMTRAYCQHTNHLSINTDTQLVRCTACNLEMSAYSALMLLCKEWNRMHWDLSEWQKMKAEQALLTKESKVRRMVRQLQWVELPGETEPEARQYWERITELQGKAPYAMFRHGRGKRGTQYCVLSETGGWTDAEFLISSLNRPVVVRES